MRRLTLTIAEPIPGKVLPKIVDSHDAEEASLRYRAIIVTTLRQLRGLKDTRIHIKSEPSDAAEAIRFWLLPRLADSWQSDNGRFHADGWDICFEDDGSYDIEAIGDALCPFLCARWVHTAMIGLEQGNHQAIGPARNGGHYFTACSTNLTENLKDLLLPELPIIQSDKDWNAALNTPLGPALKKAQIEEQA